MVPPQGQSMGVIAEVRKLWVPQLPRLGMYTSSNRTTTKHGCLPVGRGSKNLRFVIQWGTPQLKSATLTTGRTIWWTVEFWAALFADTSGLLFKCCLLLVWLKCCHVFPVYLLGCSVFLDHPSNFSYVQGRTWATVQIASQGSVCTKKGSWDHLFVFAFIL
jgi:hypothetical protein